MLITIALFGEYLVTEYEYTEHTYNTDNKEEREIASVWLLKELSVKGRILTIKTYKAMLGRYGSGKDSPEFLNLFTHLRKSEDIVDMRNTIFQHTFSNPATSKAINQSIHRTLVDLVYKANDKIKSLTTREREVTRKMAILDMLVKELNVPKLVEALNTLNNTPTQEKERTPWG